MVFTEELLEADLATASRVASETIPDIVVALDQLVPRITSGTDRTILRRYVVFVDAAAQALTALPARRSGNSPSSAVVYRLLRRDNVELPWVAPSPDGLGIVTALVDRLRGVVAGLPQQCVQARRDIDDDQFNWFMKAIAEIEYEQELASPLRRAMTTLDLSSAEVADLMGVTRQAVDKWLLSGPPSERMGKIGVIAEISDVLRYRLRAGMPAVVARREADAYGGRSMLDLIAGDEHEWLLQSVNESFDFARVA
ncbi:MAG: hypothetical protein OXF75_02220 [Acidimicrobiaceae bacterium]|nr:hypothetical protein [Acidimicrobiaceae bacterium]